MATMEWMTPGTSWPEEQPGWHVDPWDGGEPWESSSAPDVTDESYGWKVPGSNVAPGGFGDFEDLTGLGQPTDKWDAMLRNLGIPSGLGAQAPARAVPVTSSGGASSDSELRKLIGMSDAEAKRSMAEQRADRARAMGLYEQLANTPSIPPEVVADIQRNLMRRFGSQQAGINEQTRAALSRSGISTGGRRVEMQRRNLAATGPSFAQAYTQAAIQAAMANASSRRQGLSGMAGALMGASPIMRDYTPEIALEAERLGTERNRIASKEQRDLDLALLARYSPRLASLVTGEVGNAEEQGGNYFGWTGGA